MDIAGNVYIADTGNSAIKEWTAESNAVITLASTRLSYLSGIAVDGSGNVYVADADNSVIEKWTAVSNTVTTIVSPGLNSPSGVAVGGTGNVYIADTGNNAVKETPYAFVNPSPKMESAAAGNDVLSVVLPTTANLLPPFSPTSGNPAWLTIGGITNGVVIFSFAANVGSSRMANISLLGQTIAVTQGGPTFNLGTTALLVEPTAGSNSVALGVVPSIATWTATTDASWLHLTPANQSGTGSTNVVFSYEANPGATRSGTLIIAGQTLDVTQAGSTYVATATVTTLVSSGLNRPDGVAVNGAGNVYIADTHNSRIKEWTPANTNVTAVATGQASGLAVNGLGYVYFSSTDNSIYEWTPALTNSPFILLFTTVRVLKGVNAGMSNVYGPLVHERGCERLEVFMRFSPSSSFAKLPGCMLENLFSPNSPT